MGRKAKRSDHDSAAASRTDVVSNTATRGSTSRSRDGWSRCVPSCARGQVLALRRLPVVLERDAQSPGRT
jgi:hypothetical protein